jgi:uncharacterized membrane protein
MSLVHLFFNASQVLCPDFFSPLVTIPVAPMNNDMDEAIHISHSVYMFRDFYFNFFSASFLCYRPIR